MDSFEPGQICCFGGEGDVQAVNKSQSANKWAVQKWIGMGYTMLYPNTYIFLGPSIKKHDKLWIWGYPVSEHSGRTHVCSTNLKGLEIPKNRAAHAR